VVTLRRPGPSTLCMSAWGVQGIVEPRPGGSVGYPELAGDRSCGSTAVEGLDQYLLVFGGQCRGLRSPVAASDTRPG
jgi:hypothetical protein